MNIKQFNIDTLKVVYVPTHKQTKYCYNGKWYNAGEIAEIIAKFGYGYKAVKDGNTSYCDGSDIEEIHASVKSSKASLTDAIRGNSYTEIYNTYFENVASVLWIWCEFDIATNTATTYEMNKAEFQEFMTIATGYEASSKRIRFKVTNKTMREWLGARAE